MLSRCFAWRPIHLHVGLWRRHARRRGLGGQTPVETIFRGRATGDDSKSTGCELGRRLPALRVFKHPEPFPNSRRRTAVRLLLSTRPVLTAPLPRQPDRSAPPSPLARESQSLRISRRRSQTVSYPSQEPSLGTGLPLAQLGNRFNRPHPQMPQHVRRHQRRPLPPLALQAGNGNGHGTNLPKIPGRPSSRSGRECHPSGIRWELPQNDKVGD